MSDTGLYTLAIDCLAARAEGLAALFEEEALAVSVLAPPREPQARVDILLGFAPGEAWTDAHWGGPDGRAAAGVLAHAVQPVGNLDWIKKVAEDFPPLSIGRWTIFGAAHREKITDFRHALQIDATSAFGTGEHPTTRGCLEALDRFLNGREAAGQGGGLNGLDMGCGSGILAMALAKGDLRAHVLAVDMDGPSVAIARENARVNDVASRVVLIEGEGYAPPEIARAAPFDLIMANIFADPLCAMAPDLAARLKTGGGAILSGLLNEQASAVIAAHEAQGLVLADHQKVGAWSVLALVRPM